MNLFPAIDLRGGKVVRLLKGDFGAETVYGSDAVDVATSFVEHGAEWIHIVDLDAARTGAAGNRELIAAITAKVDVPVQSGGGVRDLASAEALLETGVQRIVIGTAAHEQPELVDVLAAKYPGRIAVGLDARDSIVATRGWVTGSGSTVLDLVRRFENVGVDAFIITDIERDGTLGGPDVDGLTAVVGATSVDVIASGGVGSLTDLQALAGVSADGRRLAGTIVGKAIYEQKFTVEQAVAVCAL